MAQIFFLKAGKFGECLLFILQNEFSIDIQTVNITLFQINIWTLKKFILQLLPIESQSQYKFIYFFLWEILFTNILLK